MKQVCDASSKRKKVPLVEMFHDIVSKNSQKVIGTHWLLRLKLDSIQRHLSRSSTPLIEV